MFENLFKFSRLNFTEGDVSFQLSQGSFWTAVLAILILLALLGAVYWMTRVYQSSKSKAISLGLRLAALSLLAIPLLEPVLITPDVVADENFVAVLVDQSNSMSIKDGEFGETRYDDVNHLLFNEESGMAKGIAENFKIRYYQFAEQVNKVDTLATATNGESTNISQALSRVMSDFKGLPLAGIVLLSDGGDHSTEVSRNAAETLRQEGIPLHIVGLGQESFERERELLAVSATKAVEASTGAEIDVKLRSWSEENAPVAINVYQGESLVHTEQRQLKGDGKIDQFTFFYEPQIVGAQSYRIETATANNEINTINNSTDVLIDSRKDTIRVLYFEGHLRRDFKFIKRALEDDQVIEFSSVSRTGTGKVYRQGIENAQDLAGGFPISEAELDRYKAVVIGDIEASAFAPEQLALLEKFVRVRGGGLLMLGGRVSLAEGDYWNTPIADLLPVEIDPSRKMVLPPRFSDQDDPDAPKGFKFQPTAAGLQNPILKLSADEVTNRSQWNGMPGLTSINYLGPLKAGALLLAEKPSDQFGDQEPLLAVQRYGKGRSAILATASTWRWQMQLPAEDNRHARFWRQLTRWLAASSPDKVNLDLGASEFAPGDDIPLSTELFTDTYGPLEGAQIKASITSPDGQVRELDLEEELTTEGRYSNEWTSREIGLHKIEVLASVDGRTIGRSEEHFQVRPSNREFINATLQKDLLEDLALASNGVYYAAADTESIPKSLSERRTSSSIFTTEYLWDMPFLFGLILLLLSIEWIYRRRKGLL